MGFFVRSSFKAGPVRFNFSKSGVGLSVGVKGLRVGVRPSGRAYVHAGRYGIYYRNELGSITSGEAPPTPADLSALRRGPVTSLEGVLAGQLGNRTGHPLVRMLKLSRGGIRWDYFAMLASIPTTAALAWLASLGVVGCLIALFALSYFVLCVRLIAKWESRRRTLRLDFDLRGNSSAVFERVVAAVNQLVACHSVWRMTSREAVTSLAARKRVAGANALITRHLTMIGSGSPQWLESNVPLPTIRLKHQTVYFLPDGLLLDDFRGLVHVPYSNLQIDVDQSVFVEDGVTPPDAQIVGHTWEHPNQDGSPDRRFSNNRQLPMCLYGKVAIHSADGVNIQLQTSRLDSSTAFFQNLTSAQNIENSDESGLCENSYIGVSEHFGESAQQGVYRFATTAVLAVDEVLRKVSGEGNRLIHIFLRGLLGAWLIFVLIVAIARIAR